MPNIWVAKEISPGILMKIRQNKKLSWMVFGLIFLAWAPPGQAQDITESVNSLFTDSSTDITTLGDTVIGSQSEVSGVINQNLSGTISAAEVSAQLAEIYATGFEGVADLLLQVGEDFVASTETVFTANFETFVEAFSSYYGQAALFTPHLSYPIGYDNMGGFPSLYLGFGAGMGFSNVNQVKNASSPEAKTVFDGLDSIPAVGMGINAGFGVSDKWDLRFSIFPKRTIVLPSSEDQLADFDTFFTYNSAKVKGVYNVWEGRPGMPGLSISGFLAYTKGNINVKTGETYTDTMSGSKYSTDGLTAIDYQLSAQTSYHIELDTSWEYYSMGPEVRIWYNLLFIAPYAGYALGFQYGKMTTALNFNGAFNTSETVYTIAVPTGDRYVTNKEGEVPFQSSVVSEVKAPLVQHRFYLGAEIKLLLASIAIELQIDPIHQITGAGAAASVKF